MPATLRDWSFGFLDTHRNPMSVTGDIYEDHRFEQGSTITTSNISNVFFNNVHVVVETVNGSQYILEDPAESFKNYVNIVKEVPPYYMSTPSNKHSFSDKKETVALLKWFLGV